MLVKYAQAEKYLSGIDLNPDDIINLADHYSPSVGASESSTDSTVFSPPPPSTDSQAPTNGKEYKPVPVESHDSDELTGDDARAEIASSSPASSSLWAHTLGTTAAGYGQVPLQDEVSGSLDVLYYGPLYVGTPLQALTVDFDTGSADLWLPANCGNCHGRQYEAGRSSTYHPTNQEVSITYVGRFHFAWVRYIS